MICENMFAMLILHALILHSGNNIEILPNPSYKELNSSIIRQIAASTHAANIHILSVHQYALIEQSPLCILHGIILIECSSIVNISRFTGSF